MEITTIPGTAEMRCRCSFGQDRRKRDGRKYTADDAAYAGNEEPTAVSTKNGNTTGKPKESAGCGTVSDAERKGHAAANRPG